MDNSLFICSTQYQLLNCLNIINGSEKQSRNQLLLIKNNKDLLNRLNVEKIQSFFSKVDVLETCDLTASKWSIYAFILKLFISSDSILKHTKFDNVYITGTEMYSKIFAMKIWKKGGAIHYYEDGLGSYSSVLSKTHKYKQDTVFYYLYRKRPLDICDSLHVYKPQLVINNDFGIKINSILFNEDDGNGLNIMDFFKDRCVVFEKKFVFLNAWFNDSDMKNEQLHYIECLSDTVPNDYCVKLHPSEKSEEWVLKYNVEDCGNFELANAAFDMSDKVYISIISTACLTPFLLFNRKPTVIFLYKIFLKKFNVSEWGEADKVIMRFCEEYGNNIEIIIPNTVEDFQNTLSNISRRKK